MRSGKERIRFEAYYPNSKYTDGFYRPAFARGIFKNKGRKEARLFLDEKIEFGSPDIQLEAAKEMLNLRLAIMYRDLLDDFYRFSKNKENTIELERTLIIYFRDHVFHKDLLKYLKSNSPNEETREYAYASFIIEGFSKDKVNAIKDFLTQYPDSKYKEDIRKLIVDG